MTNTIEAEFARLTTAVQTSLLSTEDLSEHIRLIIADTNSPLSGLTITVDKTDAEPLTIGHPLTTDPDRSESLQTTGARYKGAKLKLWLREPLAPSASNLATLVAKLATDLFTSWLLPEQRNQKTNLLSWNQQVKQRGAGRLLANTGQGLPLTVIFCDIDNFKAINNRIGQAGGDKVIGELAAFLETHCDPNTVLIHHGGDEFVLVLTSGDASDAIEMTARLTVRIRNHNFSTDGLPVTISFGIAPSIEHPALNFEALVHNADKEALKRFVKSDTAVKGAMRTTCNDAKPPEIGTQIADSAYPLVLRRGLNSPRSTVFANVWLEALVKSGRRLALDKASAFEIRDAVFATLETMRLPFGTIDYAALPGGVRTMYAPAVSRLDVLAVIALLLLDKFGRSELERRELCIIQDETSARLLLGNETIAEYSGQHGSARRITVGPAWHIPTSGDVNNSRFVLLEIGRNELLYLPHLSAAHIVIDDRPTRGGGLPDFWQLSLSRLFVLLEQLPNVRCIVAVGPRSGAEMTLDKLTSLATENTERLSAKTMLSMSTLRGAIDRVQGNIKHFETEDEALLECARVSSRSDQLHANPLPNSPLKQSALRRTLNYPEGALGFSHGCQLRTAAQAYPFVLEVLRTPPLTEDRILDQDQRQLRELVDFKVVLSNPMAEPIPRYFDDADRASLEAYYQREFRTPGGRFHDELVQNSAEDRVLEHVRWAVGNLGHKPFATRRAILVIPHRPPSAPQDVAPLGLVAVRLLPRPTPSGVEISYSFTWRTVEALIGFPYSLYGSIQYAEYLRRKLESLGLQYVSVGSLSYVANSLHLFLDDASLRIARGIVNDASA